MLEIPEWRRQPDDAERTVGTIDRWVSSSALLGIASAFGFDSRSEVCNIQLDLLDRFAADTWDFRQGRERNLAVPAGLSRLQTALVLDAACELGLAARSAPQRRHYDVIMMTGGMVRAGIVKPRAVAQFLESGITADEIVFLGAYREFAGDEARLAMELGIEGTNELDAMTTGIVAAFGDLGEPNVVGSTGVRSWGSWCEYSWQTSFARICVVAAPSSVPLVRRANSADTYRFWVANRPPGAGAGVLQVTTPIYVPYQATSAVEVLGLENGYSVETVSTPSAAEDLAERSQNFTAAHHLQELRSALSAMRALRGRLVQSPQ